MKEESSNFGETKLYDGEAHPASADGVARVPDGGEDSTIEAAEECPGECIFIEL